MRNLFTTWYECGNADRQKELDHCLKTNCESGLFDRVYVRITDIDFDEPNVEHELIHYCESGQTSKPTYHDFFRSMNVWSQDDNDINIIANTDIIFDETILLADNMQPDECYALSRWEMDSFTEKYMAQIQVYGDSQDAWIFRGRIKPMEYTDFPLGTRGCDNRIAHEIYKAGYKISNPSKSIKCWHLHKSNVRDYEPGKGYAVPEPYLNVPVAAL